MRASTSSGVSSTSFSSSEKLAGSGRSKVGTISNSASNLKGCVLSISRLSKRGWVAGRAFISSSARSKYLGSRLRVASWRITSWKRFSAIWRGNLPGRKPGTLMCWLICAYTSL